MVSSNAKRSYSESEDSDLFLEDLTRSPSIANESSSDIQVGYHMDRKRRRGMIEKRRRDRINNSLNDLKNLIPSACERQASTKLEKSEILHLAVEHIRNLQDKDCSNPQAMAMDYRCIGFRECIGEMISYVTNVEGLNTYDPLHSRLIEHLYKRASMLEYSSSPSLQKQSLYPSSCQAVQAPIYKHEPSSQPHPASNSECYSYPQQPANSVPVKQTSDCDYNVNNTLGQTAALSFSFTWPQNNYTPQHSWV